MPVETLSWANQVPAANANTTQLADFVGVSHTSNNGAGSIVVKATLLDGVDVFAAQGTNSGGTEGINGTAQTFPTTVAPAGSTYADAQVTNTGELSTGGNYNGAAATSALILRNLEGGSVNGFFSPAGPSTTVSLQLDFTTNNPATYSNGVDYVNFWISDIDKYYTYPGTANTSVWDDQVKITAYDTAGNPLPAGAITFPPANIGSNVAVTPGFPAVINVNPANAPQIIGNSNPAGSVQVVVNGTAPVGRVVIEYDNLGTGGQLIKISDLTMSTLPAAPACFVKGTRILTENGEVAIEDLAEGDLVVTAGNGLVPLRWIGQRTVSASGAFAPIVISKGALGNTRDLAVSPAHRMVVSDARVSALFCEDEVLVAAKSLVDGDRIYRKTGGTVTYFHILFDEHEVVFANGAPSESMYLVESALAAFSEDTQAEVMALFPELNGMLPAAGEPARPVLNASEAALLVN